LVRPTSNSPLENTWAHFSIKPNAVVRSMNNARQRIPDRLQVVATVRFCIRSGRPRYLLGGTSPPRTDPVSPRRLRIWRHDRRGITKKVPACKTKGERESVYDTHGDKFRIVGEQGAHAPCHVTCRKGVKNDHIFGIPVAILPIHYTTFMGLR